MARGNAHNAKVCSVVRRHEKVVDEQDRGAWHR